EAVEWQIGSQRRIGRVRADPDADGVTVGTGLRYRRGSDRAGSAAAILDDDLLPGLQRELLRDDARDLIDRTAGRKYGDHLDRFGRPILGDCRRGERGCENKSKADKYQANSIHTS